MIMDRTFFENQIEKSRIVRRHPVQVTVPTFQSYEVTKKTIEKLFAQRNVAIDILLIDNHSEDYVQLSQDFPQINYIVAKENTGSGGAQCLGMHAAIFYDYEILVCTDNDALLLSDDGLSKLLQRINPQKGIECVVPQNVENSMEPQADYRIPHPVPFHYICLTVALLKRIEPMNYYYFLYSDDIAFSSKVLSHAVIHCAGDVLYYHEKYQIKAICAGYQYFHLRGLLILACLERNVALKFRIRHFLNAMFKMFLAILRTIQFRDLLYLKIVVSAIGQVLGDYRTFRFPSWPKERFQYIEVDEQEGAPRAVIISVRNALWLRTYYKYPKNFAHRTAYFKRIPHHS
jgi:GT2 family glycosyltransferase